MGTLCQSPALLPADTPPQSPIDIGIGIAKAFEKQNQNSESGPAICHLHNVSRQNVLHRGATLQPKPVSLESQTSGEHRRVLRENENDMLVFVPFHLDIRSTDTVCIIDSPLAIKQEEEEEISQKLKMTKVDDRSSRLVSRCSRVMDSLAREIKLVETLASIRGDIQARQDLALKSARVYRSEGINMLVVLMAMKWKCTALKQTLDPRSMTHLARLKTRIYLDNKVHAAMHRSTSRLNLVC